MHIRITQDSFEENVRWLEVSHNGSAWSTVRIQNDDEALQIANVLQQSVQPTLLTPEPTCETCKQYHSFAHVEPRSTPTANANRWADYSAKE